MVSGVAKTPGACNREDVIIPSGIANLVVVIRSVDRSVDAESGEADICTGPLPKTLAERKVIAPIWDRRDASVHHLKDVDPILVKEAAVEKLYLERQLLITPQRLLRHETDGSVLIIIEILQRIRQLLVGSREWLCRKRAGKLAYVGGTEGRGRARLSLRCTLQHSSS